MLSKILSTTAFFIVTTTGLFRLSNARTFWCVTTMINSYCFDIYPPNFFGPIFLPFLKFWVELPKSKNILCTSIFNLVIILQNLST